MAWLLWVGAVWAAKVTSAELDAWAAEESVRVEQVTGRTFVVRPVVEIATEAEVRRAATATDPPPSNAQEASLDRALQRALAIYVPRRQKIYLMAPNLERMYARMAVTQAEFEAAIRHTLAHELTHALQDQRLPDRAFGAATAEILDEGMAVLAAERIQKNPRVNYLMQAVTGAGGLSSAAPDDPQVMAYGFSARFMDRVERAAGWEGVWAARADPAPQATIWEVVEPTLARAWADPAGLRQALTILDPHATEERVEATSASRWLGPLDAASVEPQWAFGGDGGLVLHATAGWRRYAVGVTHVEDAAQVQRWFRARLARIGRGRWIPLRGFGGAYSEVSGGSFFSSLRLGPSVTIRGTLAEVGTVGVRQPLCPREVRCVFRELWALRGKVLVGVAVFGPAATWRAQTEAVEHVWTQYAGDRPPPHMWPPLAWQPSVSDPDAVRAGWLGTWVQLRVREGRPCRVGLERWLPKVPPEGRAAIERLAAGCAD